MILDNLKEYKIILASNSPRRKELLSGIGIEYEVKTMPDIDETYPDALKGEEIPQHIAKSKANAYLPTMKENELIITADTIVYIDGEVLGKPKDADDASRMLHKLSGKSHKVITGVCITTSHTQRVFATSSDVTFNNLTDEEIDYYISEYKPFDKAGAYGIQEWIGFIGVTALQGSYFNIMGLPIQRLYQELKRI